MQAKAKAKKAKDDEDKARLEKEKNLRELEAQKKRLEEEKLAEDQKRIDDEKAAKLAAAVIASRPAIFKENRIQVNFTKALQKNNVTFVQLIEELITEVKTVLMSRSPSIPNEYQDSIGKTLSMGTYFTKDEEGDKLKKAANDADALAERTDLASISEFVLKFKDVYKEKTVHEIKGNITGLYSLGLILNKKISSIHNTYHKQATKTLKTAMRKELGLAVNTTFSPTVIWSAMKKGLDDNEKKCLDVFFSSMTLRGKMRRT